MRFFPRCVPNLPLAVGIPGAVKLAPDSGTLDKIKVANLQNELIRSSRSNL